MYVQCNTEARLYNHYCSGKAMSITQPVCAFVAVGVQQAKRMHHIIICGLAGMQNHVYSLTNNLPVSFVYLLNSSMFSSNPDEMLCRIT